MRHVLYKPLRRRVALEEAQADVLRLLVLGWQTARREAKDLPGAAVFFQGYCESLVADAQVLLGTSPESERLAALPAEKEVEHVA